MEGSLINVEDLTKRNGERKTVDDMIFSIVKAAMAGFPGPHGAGKTTTMNIITGSTSASLCRVTIYGPDIPELSRLCHATKSWNPSSTPSHPRLDP